MISVFQIAVRKTEILVNDFLKRAKDCDGGVPSLSRIRLPGPGLRDGIRYLDKSLRLDHANRENVAWKVYDQRKCRNWPNITNFLLRKDLLSENIG